MSANRGSVLVLGAASDIGRAIAHAYAKAGRPVILAARNATRLDPDLKDFAVRYGVAARTVEFDVLDIAGHGAFLEKLGELPGTVVCVVGFMGEQARSEQDPAAAELVIRSNYVGPAAIMAEAANRMVARGSGTLIGISSVAGDRGRASNYVYGSAKAGFTAYLSGLRNRLAKTGVAVITVKPGFVATRMTAGMKLPKPLLAQPAEVADAVVAAEAKRRDVIYVRPVWRLVMLIIRGLPEAIFKRSKL
jgi:decaprenylphospho-beta-D-erythro-pentofuranosid-2-ulose 2-reductase